VRGEKWEMIKSYRDLEVFKESYQIALQIHRLTQKYPEFERYEIGAQMRRAAVSIPLNIAEGYGKKSSEADFKRFLKIALGSSNEMMVLIDMSKDLGYVEEEERKVLIERYDVLGKRLSSMIVKWK
jgi:four helix bundle protein